MQNGMAVSGVLHVVIFSQNLKKTFRKLPTAPRTKMVVADSRLQNNQVLDLRLTDIALLLSYSHHSPLYPSPLIPKMKVSSFVYNTLSSATSSLLDVHKELARILASKGDKADLCFLIYRLEVELATLKEADSQKELVIKYLGQQLNCAETTAARLIDTVEGQQNLIAMGLGGVQDLLEDVYRFEARTREADLKFVEDLAAKDDLFKIQATRIDALLKSAKAAQEDISTLQKKIVTDGAKHRRNLSAVQHAQAARDVAHANIVLSQQAEIDALKTKVTALQTDAAASQAAQKVLIAADAAKVALIRRQRGTIGTLRKRLDESEKSVGRGLADALKLKKAVATQASEITSLKTGTKALKTEVQRLKTEVKEGKAEAVEMASRAVAQNLRVSGMMARLQERAFAAEQEVKRTKDAAKATVAHIAATHAKERRIQSATKEVASNESGPVTSRANPTDIAAANVPGNADTNFSLDCAFKFSPHLIVHAQSAFAQASIAEPSAFTTESGRRIVRRGGDSSVTPLLLPAWPAPEGREEDSRAQKRAKF
ncbi:hypothetical protein C8R43DRAFT_1244837 [Mycena crocata]|nr:hypothetical protein C8R43DRAFT_1244837 [Mycena crocata]